MSDLKYLKQKLTELILTREIKVSTGNIPDFEVYRSVCGELTGLRLAVRELEDLQMKINEANNV